MRASVLWTLEGLFTLQKAIRKYATSRKGEERECVEAIRFIYTLEGLQIRSMKKQRKLAKEVTLNVLYKALLLTMKKAC